MSEDSNPPSSTPTPTSNQNLIIGLVLGAGVLLLLFLVLNIKFGSGSGDSDASEVAALRKEISDRRAFINEERRIAGLPPLGVDASGQTVESLAARISTDSTDLVAMVRQMQKLLAEKETRLANSDTTFDALTHQNTKLLEELKQLRSAAQDAESLRNRLGTAQSMYESAQAKIDDLQAQLAGTPSSTEMARLRTELEQALRQRDEYEAELTGLRTEVATLRTEKVDLHYELQKVRADLSKTRLFAESVDELPAAAKALFVRLAAFETLEGRELAKEYTMIENDLNARMAGTISFQTGSALINLDKVEETRMEIGSTGERSYFLVVGYASKTGDFESNKSLSSDRATNVASVADQYRKPTQGIKAVFLGQTDRFSKSDPVKNQICEIWEIRE